MRVHKGFDALPPMERPVVTVGSFDGVHTGHRKLLETVAATARAHGGRSVVVTFDPHPREVLEGSGAVGLLTTLPEKTLLLERAGIDELIVVPFTREFSRLSSEEFVERMLVGRVGMAAQVVGYNHHLGRGAAGDIAALRQLAARLGFDIDIVERHDVAGADDKVSSTVIRRLIVEGHLARAAEFLGYKYFITGSTDAADVFTPSGASKLLPPAGTYDVSAGGRAGKLRIAPDGTLRLSLPVAGQTPVEFLR